MHHCQQTMMTSSSTKQQQRQQQCVRGSNDAVCKRQQHSPRLCGGAAVCWLTSGSSSSS
jgi:hypothetical protein